MPFPSRDYNLILSLIYESICSLSMCDKSLYVLYAHKSSSPIDEGCVELSKNLATEKLQQNARVVHSAALHILIIITNVSPILTNWKFVQRFD